MNTASLRRTDGKYELPLFIFLTIILVGIYGWSLVDNPALREPHQFILFTLLMFIHLVLHWSIYGIYNRPRWHIPYLIVQGLLAFLITHVAGNVGMTFGLFMALIGESMGMLRKNIVAVTFTISYFIFLAILSYILIRGWNTLSWALLVLIPMTSFVIIYVGLYTRQAKDREEAQTLAIELEKANQQLTEYAARVEDLTIANERQRLARELHDTLSQGLAGLILQLEAADAHLTNRHADKAQAIISDAMEQARATLTDARRAIDDLRQSAVDDLESALRSEISRFTIALGIPIHFHADPIPPLSDPVKETLIRVMAESLTNIANHARAQNVEVKVRMKDQSLLVTIQDDGQGFDASAVPAGHYGLLGIRERVRLVNGSFEIQSEKSQGTTLKITIPVPVGRNEG